MKVCERCDYPYDECECLTFGLSPQQLKEKKALVKKHKKKLPPQH